MTVVRDLANIRFDLELSANVSEYASTRSLIKAVLLLSIQIFTCIHVYRSPSEISSKDHLREKEKVVFFFNIFFHIINGLPILHGSIAFIFIPYCRFTSTTDPLSEYQRELQSPHRSRFVASRWSLAFHGPASETLCETGADSSSSLGSSFLVPPRNSALGCGKVCG